MTQMLTALLILATITFAYITVKSISYEIRKGHANHAYPQTHTLAYIPARHTNRSDHR